MAKPAWLMLNPLSGSGNGSIENAATTHTGRVARTGTVTVTGTGVNTPATYTVTQSPKAEFVSFDNGSNLSSPKGGGNLTVAGKTNSSKLTFSFGTGGNIVVTLPNAYTANGASVNNGTTISGDPGAVSEFAFSIQLSIPANTTVSENTKTLIVVAEGGQSAQITINQTAGDATLSVSPGEITLPQNGSAVSVAVTSNTSWTVS